MGAQLHIHHCDQLVAVFNRCFAESMNTRLVKGGDEPIYLPADQDHSDHRIIFTRDYFASALHEVAHWCIAGPRRLLLEDYGYWYCPDGRSAEQQQAFEAVEIKPQAVEWLLHMACGHRFRVSIDNLNGDAGDPRRFKDNIHTQVQTYCRQDFPRRAAIFARALADEFRMVDPFDPGLYRRADLG